MALLNAKDVHVSFPIRSGGLFNRVSATVRAVDGMSVSLERGATYGLVGESGCGKSTFGRALLRLIEPNSGEIWLDDVELSALSAQELRKERRRMQMIFQDPFSSLDPRQTVKDAILEPLRTHGLLPKSGRRDEVVLRMLDSVGLPRNAAGRYPHEFSGGQRQRIGIARAIVLEPDLIIADEPVSALDVSVQAQIINLMKEIQDEIGVAYLVIAHDLAVVRYISDTCGVMYLGSLMEEADSEELYRRPLHPYTLSLMSAIPVPEPRVAKARDKIILRGEVPSPKNVPQGCRFHTRCPFMRKGICDTERPELRELAPGHMVACHFAEEIEANNTSGTTSGAGGNVWSGTEQFDDASA